MRNLRQQVEQPQRNTTTTFIYALIDPHTGNVRYVGKANNPKKRLAIHLQPSQLKENNHRAHWLGSIVASSQKPRMVILEEVDRTNWEKEEQKWIYIFRNIPGYPPLVNSTDGGEGAQGWIPSEEYRRKQSIRMTGIKMPPGTGAKISATNTGVRKSWKARLRLSVAQTRRWANASEEVRHKNLANLRTPWSEGKKAKRSDDARNASKPVGASSRYRNVVKVMNRGKACWKAGCIIKGKQICIGFFRSEEEAARARDRYVLKNIGETVLLNFPREDYPHNPSEIVIEKRKRIYAQVANNRNTSGYKGVTKNGKNGWAAGFNYLGVRYRLGTHRTREDAARAYDRKAIELFGDDAILNFARSDYE